MHVKSLHRPVAVCLVAAVMSLAAITAGSASALPPAPSPSLVGECLQLKRALGQVYDQLGDLNARLAHLFEGGVTADETGYVYGLQEKIGERAQTAQTIKRALEEYCGSWLSKRRPIPKRIVSLARKNL